MTCQGEHLFQHQIAWGSPPHSGFSALSRNSVVFLEVVSFHFCRQVGERNGGEEDDRVADQVTHLVGGGVGGKDAPGTPPQMSRSLPGPTGHRALCSWGTCS